MSHVLVPMIEKQVQRTIAGCPPGLHCSGFLALSLFADGIVNIPVGNKTDNTVPKALDLNSLSPELGSTGSHKSEAGAHLQNTLKN